MWQYNYSDDIYHHGVKGMKWGVRHERKNGNNNRNHRGNKYDHTNALDKTVLKTKNGAEISLTRKPTPRLTKLIAKMSPKVRDTLSRSDIMQIKVKGKEVGNLQLYKESPKSLNIVWVTVDSKYEGHGYGTAVVKGVIDYAKKTNMEQVTLEVPGTSPNARHIYEKLGFEAGEVISDEDDAWGGLTSMKLKLR